jgi:hypothetical protein
VLPFARGLLAACAGLALSTADAQSARAPLTGARVVRDVDSLWGAAVTRQTRNSSGAPGARAWAQSAKYLLRATLDPAGPLLRADGELRYRNRSPDTLRTLAINLAQNLFARGAPHNESVPQTGGITIDTLCVAHRAPAPAPARCADDALSTAQTRIDHTIMWVTLPTPLLPGDSVDLFAAWHFLLPPSDAPRTGSDGSVHLVTYWYPQFAVYDDVAGWVTDPYLGVGEFYADFADYDVRISLPGSYLIGATGTLQNAADILPPAVRERLQRAARSFAVVSIVNDSVRRARSATQPGAQLTWHFSAPHVRDFAFYASKDVVWDAMAGQVPRAGGGLDTVLIHALYRPRERGWRRAADMGRQSLELFSRQLWPYPWSQLTLVEGIVEGGMEYPMLTAVSVGGTSRELYSTIAHEVGHMWFPMQVSSDERRFAWMDEGLASWLERSALRASTGHDDDQDGLPSLYRMVVGMRAEQSMFTPADAYSGALMYTAASYDKLVVVFRAFSAEYGDSALVDGLRAYGEAWRGRHPYPPDFAALVFRAAGTERDDFVREWLRGTGYFDARLDDVFRERDTLTVTVRSVGGAHLSVPVTILRDDGSSETRTISAAAFRRESVQTLQVPRARAVSSIVLDVERTRPDVNPSNQRWAP